MAASPDGSGLSQIGARTASTRRAVMGEGALAEGAGQRLKCPACE